MGDRSVKICENCRFAFWAFGLAQPILICNKKKGSQGKCFVIESGACCTNYKRSRKVPHGRKTKSTDDGAKFIPLIRGGFAIVDADDYEKLAQYRWYCYHWGNSTYAFRRKAGRKIYMHREILKGPKGKVVDHKDGNGLNNRRNNLRLCTKAQNAWNSRPVPNCSSKYKGVSWDKRGKKWRAGIKYNGRRINIARFEDEVEAAKAYDRKAKELFGEFAYLNNRVEG